VAGELYLLSEKVQTQTDTKYSSLRLEGEGHLKWKLKKEHVRVWIGLM
jgi:hypothetical protein